MTITDHQAQAMIPPPQPATMQTPHRRSSSSEITRWSLAARLAWREVKHRRARSLLIVALIATPTMLMALGSIGLRSDPGSRYSGDLEFGSGDITYINQTDDTGAVDQGQFGDVLATLPAETRSDEFVWLNTRVGLSETLSSYATFTDIDLENPLTDRLEIVDGQAPGAGEMLLSPKLATALGVDVGDEINMVRPAGTWTLSGLVRDPVNYWNEMVVVDGFDASRLRYGGEVLVVDLPDTMTSREILDLSGSGILAQRHYDAAFGSTDDDTPSGSLAVWWLLGALAFMAFGIIVTAAFATNARSQLVSVAHLSANGAPQPLISKILALQGWWTGLLGGVVGVAAALALVPVLKGSAEKYWYSQSVSTVVRPVDLAVVILTAMAAGTLAALIPGRSLARTSVLDALAGRRPEGKVPRWLVPAGFTLFGLGVLVVLAAVTASQSNGMQAATTATMIIGVAAMGLGVCAVTPWIVERLGLLADRLRLAPRLALRTMARTRARSAAVISAIAVTAATAIVIAAAVQYQTNATGDDWMARDTFVISAFDDWDGDSAFVPTDRTVPDEVAGLISDRFPDAQVEPNLTAYIVDIEGPDRILQPVTIATDASINAYRWNSTGIAALDRFGYVFSARPEEVDDEAIPSPPFTQGESDIPMPVPVANGTDNPDGGSSLMTADFAAANGFTVVANGVVVTLPADMTEAQAAQLIEVRDRLWNTENPAYSNFIEPGDDASPDLLNDTPISWQVNDQYVDFDLDRRILTGRLVAFGLALAGTALVVAIGLALAAADSKRDREILVVSGAKPSLMRRLSAVDAATLAIIGILLGIPAGYFPARAVVAAADRSAIRALEFPWQFATGLVVVVPLMLAGAAWILTRPRTRVAVSAQ